MRKFQFILFLGIASAMMAGCKKDPRASHIIPISVSLDTTLNELGDSSFVPPQVRCMDGSDGLLYYADYAGGVVILNKDYQMVKHFGVRGQGPDELLGAAHFCLVGNDSIYILNEGKHSIEMFVGGEHRLTIPFPANARFTFNTRFFADKGKIYHSVINKESPVVAFDNDTSIFMCSYTPFDDPSMGRHATKHVLKGHDSFFLIGCVYPTLEQYSMGGKLLKSFDLGVIPAVSRMIQAYRDSPKDPGSYFTVIQDAYYCENRLYLLIGLLEDGDYLCNTVAVLDLSDVEWKYVACLHLSGRVYDTFCINNGKIYAHDSTRSCIDIFHLGNEVD